MQKKGMPSGRERRRRGKREKGEEEEGDTPRDEASFMKGSAVQANNSHNELSDVNTPGPSAGGGHGGRSESVSTVSNQPGSEV